MLHICRLIFRVEESATEETSVKQKARKLCSTNVIRESKTSVHFKYIVTYRPIARQRLSIHLPREHTKIGDVFSVDRATIIC
jgi:hypothetical protein